jgi:hypothetical protein
MKFTIILTFVLGLLTVSTNANDPAVWKSLSFGVATVEDAVAVAGKPSKRKIEKMKVYDEKDGKVTGTRNIQVIEFKKVDEWQRVALGFLDGKFYKAKFWPKNKTLPASDLPARHGSDFVAVEALTKKVSLSVFEGQKEPEVPRVYPLLYFMVSSVPDRNIVAAINNASWKNIWKDSFSLPTIKMFPGFVESIEIVSRHGESQ